MKKKYITASKLPAPLFLLILCTPVMQAQFDTRPEELKGHVYYLAADSMLGRGFGTPQGLQAAHYIAAQFEAAGLEPIGNSYLHPFNYRRGILNIPGNNVVGVVRGNDPALRDEYIVLGAHYDHLGWKIEDGDTVVYNGADDNASGTATIIETGRNLAAQRDSLKRSVILVAFDGEESGLIGSTYFLKDSVVLPHQIRAMFSLDMVGMMEAYKGVDLKGLGRLVDRPVITGELAAKHGVVVKKANKRVEQRTDTGPFGKAGIPAIAVFTGLKSPYHKPEDDADKLDYEGMAQIANFMSDASQLLSTTGQVSTRPGPRAGESLNGGPKILRPGFRLNIGSSLHNYRNEFYKGKSILSAGTGFFLNVRAAGFLNIQPEILYETRGSLHTDGVFRTHSLTVPLNVQLITPDDELVRSYFQAGIYYSHPFAGTVDGTAIDFTADYTDREIGISYGVGFELMNVQLGVCMQRSLTDLDRAESDHIRHESVCFSLGILF